MDINNLATMSDAEFDVFLGSLGTSKQSQRKKLVPFRETPEATKPPDVGFIKGNLMKSAGSFGQMTGGALGLFGDLVGLENIKNYGLSAVEGAQMFNRGVNERMMTPETNIGETYDKQGLWEAAKETPQFIAEQAIQNLPLMIGTGGITGLAARSGAKASLASYAGRDLAEAASKEAIAAASKRGAIDAAIASSAQWGALESGSIYAEQENKDPLKALGYGMLAGSLEILPEMALARSTGLGRKLMGLPAPEAATKHIVKVTAAQGAKNVAIDLLGQATMEGVQEIGQTGLELLGKDKNLTDRESIKEMIISGIAGAGIGGGMAAPISTVKNVSQYLQGKKPITDTTTETSLTAAPTNNEDVKIKGEIIKGAYDALVSQGVPEEVINADKKFGLQLKALQKESLKKDVTEQVGKAVEAFLIKNEMIIADYNDVKAAAIQQGMTEEAAALGARKLAEQTFFKTGDTKLAAGKSTLELAKKAYDLLQSDPDKYEARYQELSQKQQEYDAALRAITDTNARNEFYKANKVEQDDVYRKLEAMRMVDEGEYEPPKTTGKKGKQQQEGKVDWKTMNEEQRLAHLNSLLNEVESNDNLSPEDVAKASKIEAIKEQVIESNIPEGFKGIDLSSVEDILNNAVAMDEQEHTPLASQEAVQNDLTENPIPTIDSEKETLVEAPTAPEEVIEEEVPSFMSRLAAAAKAKQEEHIQSSSKIDISDKDLTLNAGADITKFNPKFVVKLYHDGMAAFYGGANTFAKFADHMHKKYGNNVVPHLKMVWNKVKRGIIEDVSKLSPDDRLEAETHFQKEQHKEQSIYESFVNKIKPKTKESVIENKSADMQKELDTLVKRGKQKKDLTPPEVARINYLRKEIPKQVEHENKLSVPIEKREKIQREKAKENIDSIEETEDEVISEDEEDNDIQAADEKLSYEEYDEQLAKDQAGITGSEYRPNASMKEIEEMSNKKEARLSEQTHESYLIDMLKEAEELQEIVGSDYKRERSKTHRSVENEAKLVKRLMFDQNRNKDNMMLVGAAAVDVITGDFQENKPTLQWVDKNDKLYSHVPTQVITLHSGTVKIQVRVPSAKGLQRLIEHPMDKEGNATDIYGGQHVKFSKRLQEESANQVKSAFTEKQESEVAKDSEVFPLEVGVENKKLGLHEGYSNLEVAAKIKLKASFKMALEQVQNYTRFFHRLDYNKPSKWMGNTVPSFGEFYNAIYEAIQKSPYSQEQKNQMYDDLGKKTKQRHFSDVVNAAIFGRTSNSVYEKGKKDAVIPVGGNYITYSMPISDMFKYNLIREKMDNYKYDDSRSEEGSVAELANKLYKDVKAAIIITREQYEQFEEAYIAIARMLDKAFEQLEKVKVFSIRENVYKYEKQKEYDELFAVVDKLNLIHKYAQAKYKTIEYKEQQEKPENFRERNKKNFENWKKNTLAIMKAVHDLFATKTESKEDTVALYTKLLSIIGRSHKAEHSLEYAYKPSKPEQGALYDVGQRFSIDSYTGHVMKPQAHMVLYSNENYRFGVDIVVNQGHKKNADGTVSFITTFKENGTIKEKDSLKFPHELIKIMINLGIDSVVINGKNVSINGLMEKVAAANRILNEKPIEHFFAKTNIKNKLTWAQHTEGQKKWVHGEKAKQMSQWKMKADFVNANGGADVFAKAIVNKLATKWAANNGIKVYDDHARTINQTAKQAGIKLKEVTPEYLYYIRSSFGDLIYRNEVSKLLTEARGNTIAAEINSIKAPVDAQLITDLISDVTVAKEVKAYYAANSKEEREAIKLGMSIDAIKALNAYKELKAVERNTSYSSSEEVMEDDVKKIPSYIADKEPARGKMVSVADLEPVKKVQQDTSNPVVRQRVQSEQTRREDKSDVVNTGAERHTTASEMDRKVEHSIATVKDDNGLPVTSSDVFKSTTPTKEDSSIIDWLAQSFVNEGRIPSESVDMFKNGIVIGKFKNPLYQQVLTKIAELFGARLLVINSDLINSEGMLTRGEGLDKPVVVMNASGITSISKVFAHELFHHVIGEKNSEKAKMFQRQLVEFMNKEKFINMSSELKARWEAGGIVNTDEEFFGQHELMADTFAEVIWNSDFWKALYNKDMTFAHKLFVKLAQFITKINEVLHLNLPQEGRISYEYKSLVENMNGVNESFANLISGFKQSDISNDTSISHSIKDHAKKLKEGLAKEPAYKNMTPAQALAAQSSIIYRIKQYWDSIKKSVSKQAGAHYGATEVDKSDAHYIVNKPNQVVEQMDSHLRDSYRGHFSRMSDEQYIDIADAIRDGQILKVIKGEIELEDVSTVSGKAIDQKTIDFFKDIKEKYLDKQYQRLKSMLGQDAIGYTESHFGQMLQWFREDGSFNDDNVSYLFDIDPAASMIEGRKVFLKERGKMLPSKRIQGGQKPVSLNPYDLALNYMEQTEKLIAFRTRANQMKHEGRMVKVLNGQDIPKGMMAMSDNAMAIYEKIVLGEGFKKKGKTIKEVDAQVGQYFVTEGFGRMMNNALSKDLIRANPIGRTLLKMKNWFTAIELGLSMFHAFTEVAEYLSALQAWGYQEGRLNGNRFTMSIKESVLGNLVRLMIDPVNAISRVSNINRLFSEIMEASPEERKLLVEKPEFKADVKKHIGRDVDMLKLIDNYFKGGGGSHQDINLRFSNQHIDWRKGHILDSMNDVIKKELGDAKGFEGKVKAYMSIANFVALKAPTDVLFEKMIPQIKFATFCMEYAQQLDIQKKKLDAGLTTTERIAREQINFNDQRFGEMNWKNLWMNNTLKTALMLTFRSFTWKYGTFMALEQGIRGVGIFGFDAYKKYIKGEKQIELQMNQAGVWIMSAFATQIMMAAIVQAVSGFGYDDSDEDKFKNIPLYLRPLMARTEKDVMSELPGYPTEMAKIGMHIKHGEYAKIITGSFNGLLTKIYEAYNNKTNYTNEYVVNPDSNKVSQMAQMLGHFLPVPISMSEFTKAIKKGEGAESITKFFGLKEASKAMTLSGAELKARELRSANMPSEPKDDKDIEMSMRWIKAKREFDKTGTSPELDKMKQEGLVTSEKEKNFKKKLKTINGMPNPIYVDPIKQSMEKLSAENKIKVWDEMDKAQKLMYRKYIDDAITRSIQSKKVAPAEILKLNKLRREKGIKIDGGYSLKG